MEWVNPHGWLHIDVMEQDGTVVNWSIEAGAPNALVRRGLRKVDFPIGSEVIVEGAPRQERIADGQRHERDVRRRPQLLPGRVRSASGSGEIASARARDLRK